MQTQSDTHRHSMISLLAYIRPSASEGPASSQRADRTRGLLDYGSELSYSNSSHTWIRIGITSHSMFALPGHNPLDTSSCPASTYGPTRTRGSLEYCSITNFSDTQTRMKMTYDNIFALLACDPIESSAGLLLLSSFQAPVLANAQHRADVLQRSTELSGKSGVSAAAKRILSASFTG